GPLALVAAGYPLAARSAAERAHGVRPGGAGSPPLTCRPAAARAVRHAVPGLLRGDTQQDALVCYHLDARYLSARGRLPRPSGRTQQRMAVVEASLYASCPRRNAGCCLCLYGVGPGE